MRRVVAMAAVFVVLSGCGSDDGDDEAEPSSTAPRQTITITATDFALAPRSVDLDESGTYAFEVVNEGEVAHALEVEGEGIEEETKTLQPGEQATLTVDLESGSYELYCPVGDHKERGMTGKVDIQTSSSDDGY
jgi:uncharacterized cupredoxin-like copper-binding protein